MRALLLALLLAAASSAERVRYAPTWDSLDSRPNPTWYDEAKIGIFIHWGVFSVPSFGSEWFWMQWKGEREAPFVAYMNANEAPGFTYQQFAPRLTGEFFNASAWLELFKAAGARYVVPTSKHHEGFCMWPSATSFSWNAVDVGPHRDVIGELAAATRAAGLVFGVYHSLMTWFDPVYLADKAANWTTTNFVPKAMGELRDLVLRYQPEVIWSDGDWEPLDSYWDAPANFLAWLANDSPVADTAVWNDRWGSGDLCAHGSFFTCADRYLPSQIQPRKFENAFTLDTQSWGYRRNAVLGDYMTAAQLVTTVVQTIAVGGNALINVGPAADGTIDVIFEERLRALGAWLAVNGEAIYATTPWRVQNDTAAMTTWYTQRGGSGGGGGGGGVVYALFSAWPAAGGRLQLLAPVAAANASFTLLGAAGSQPLAWAPLAAPGAPGVAVQLPALSPADALAAAPAWALAMTGVR